MRPCLLLTNVPQVEPLLPSRGGDMEDGAEPTHAHEGGRKVQACKDPVSAAQRL